MFNILTGAERMLHILSFFFYLTATTEIYTLSLHDALPIYGGRRRGHLADQLQHALHGEAMADEQPRVGGARSEEHTSELQSRPHLVCRLLLEKKKKDNSSRRDCCRGPCGSTITSA